MGYKIHSTGRYPIIVNKDANPLAMLPEIMENARNQMLDTLPMQSTREAVAMEAEFRIIKAETIGDELEILFELEI